MAKLKRPKKVIAELKKEEARLVHKAVEIEMAEIMSGKVNTTPMAQVMKEAGLT